MGLTSWEDHLPHRLGPAQTCKSRDLEGERKLLGLPPLILEGKRGREELKHTHLVKCPLEFLGSDFPQSHLIVWGILIGIIQQPFIECLLCVQQQATCR